MPRLSAPVPSTATLAEVADLWRRSLKAANKAPKTVTTYLYGLDRLAEQVGADRPIDQITRRDHEALMGALQDRGWKPASVSTVYRSLRSFWGYVVDHDDLPVARDPMNGLKAPVVPEVPVVFLSDAELVRILATCKARSRHGYLGHRDEAIIRLLATTGARLSEVANLHLQDVDLGLEPTVSVMGKGRRVRELPLDDQTLSALKRYLDRERPRHPDARTLDWLWLARAGRMTASGIAQAFAERGKAAGITRRVHPHELRHRFISTMLGAGFSEGDTMSLSGHRSRAMLDRYGAITKATRAHAAFRKASASGLLPRL